MAKGYNIHKVVEKQLLKDLERMKEYLHNFTHSATEFESAVLPETKQVKFTDLGKCYKEFLICSRQVADTTIKLEEIFGGAKRGNTKPSTST